MLAWPMLVDLWLLIVKNKLLKSMHYVFIVLCGLLWFFRFWWKLLSVVSNWLAFGGLIIKMPTIKIGQYDSQTRSQITL